MTEASFDAIIVGGGHHGTIIACYLQHAGLKTAIFERQHELGGAACGEEPFSLDLFRIPVLTLHVFGLRLGHRFHITLGAHRTCC